MAITPADVAVALGRPTPDDSFTAQQWTLWIDNARLLLQYGDGVHTGLGPLEALDPVLLDYVVREAVVEHVRRPDNATSVEVAVDDGRTARTYQAGKGRVAILDEWWAMLQPAGGQSGAFSVRPAFAPDGCRGHDARR